MIVARFAQTRGSPYLEIVLSSGVDICSAVAVKPGRMQVSAITSDKRAVRS